MAERVAPLVSLPRADVQNVIDTLMALYIVRSSNDIPAASFIEDVCNAMRFRGVNGFAIDDSQVEPLRQRLSVFMAVDSLGVASKAVELQFEHERVFDRAR